MDDKPSCLVDAQVERAVLTPARELAEIPRTDVVFDESGNSLPALEYFDMMDYATIPTSLNLDVKLLCCAVQHRGHHASFMVYCPSGYTIFY